MRYQARPESTFGLRPRRAQSVGNLRYQRANSGILFLGKSRSSVPAHLASNAAVPGIPLGQAFCPGRLEFSLFILLQPTFCQISIIGGECRRMQTSYGTSSLNRPIRTMFLASLNRLPLRGGDRPARDSTTRHGLQSKPYQYGSAERGMQVPTTANEGHAVKDQLPVYITLTASPYHTHPVVLLRYALSQITHTRSNRRTYQP
jgi:hypothetical protein